MRTKDIIKIGIPPTCVDTAHAVMKAGRAAGRDDRDLQRELRSLARSPADFAQHPLWAVLARTVVEARAVRPSFVARDTSAPCEIFGQGLEEGALQQMRNACQLPVAVAGALMPDAHQGYGLPIGGVLATDNAVIPYAVGVDIACRMKLTVLDRPVTDLATRQRELIAAIEGETRFGVGATFRGRRQHAVMDEDWGVSGVTRGLKDRAWSQLGTSGSGNHFVEFGVLTVLDPTLGLGAGEYLALLSHSGSRGTGNAVAQHFSRVAQKKRPELPRELAHLAWLDLDADEGQEYWAAMELMGRYAAANHDLIHRHVVQALGAGVRLDVENHHNFAWRERHVLPGGRERDVVVHRKGATPAGRGVIGIIPGSMAAPGYVVRGRGSESSLLSASHGAGRKMSRTKAKERFSWAELQRVLRDRQVKLLSAGLDEVPMAYKDIDEVMAAQRSLVDTLARFDPRLVKMAPPGEAPED
jgi:tRNA-splicing ligase RtcB (3'-phosphate/5'-hydroxy nucleic acid ligase)